MIAALVAAAVLVASLAVVAAGGMPWWGAGVTVLAAGASAYGVVRWRVTRRLEVARETLREARKGRFEALSRVRTSEGGDELDAMLWQVYRAGRVHQQEIERLKQLENYRRDFLGNVSHELKTPIFAVSGFAEQLLDGALEDEQVRRRFVQKIADHAARLDFLTRDLLAISRIETGELKMNMAPFDVTALAAEAVEAVEIAAQRHHVRILAHLPAGLPRATGDREQLRQALVNLIDNGVKYNRDGGHVEVTARRLPEGGIRVAVTDDGLGIPAEEIQRVTERFYRVDRSRARTGGGTGLGLAIVKHILEAHGLRLNIESQPGKGSTFSFVLPAA
jgi:two-component system, OmpR family, phosphate regulon sensor histidine kinase PhoR